MRAERQRRRGCGEKRKLMERGMTNRFSRRQPALWDKTNSFWDIESLTRPRARKWASERASERMSAAVEPVSEASSAEWVSEWCERMSEWPSTYVPIPGCSEPWCNLGAALFTPTKRLPYSRPQPQRQGHRNHAATQLSLLKQLQCQARHSHGVRRTHHSKSMPHKNHTAA